MRARRILSWVIGILLAIVLVVIVIVAFVHSGIYNVAASYPDSAPVAWVLSTTMDNSVRRHAADIKVPSNLDDPAMLKMGLAHYRQMCVECHGAPGVPIGETGRGLNPDPPKMTEAANDWKPNELFWITKNGVRMTGMPAWGVTHTDEEIWAMVAFAKKLPKMKPAEYEKLSSHTPMLPGRH